MKINWGTGVVIAFVVFISFILFFVIKMSTNTAYQHDLVTEDYYKQELSYQKKINAAQNAKLLSTNIVVKKMNNGLEIIFPQDKDPTKIKGEIALYRPSNKKLDFEIPISLSERKLMVSGDQLLEGRWNITIDWEYENTPYLFKKSFVY